MRVIFAGTPGFAARALRALGDAGHDIRLVLTRQDKPAGRGLGLQPSAVKALALERGYPLHQPATLKQEADREPLVRAQAEVMVVAAYGLILPQAVLDIPRYGGINIHASLLPRWRGAAPIERALLAGDAETGISIMQMDAGLDTGPVLLSAPTAIEGHDTAGSLEDRLAAMGAELIVKVLAMLEEGRLEARAQDPATATYAAKLQKAEARIDWHRPAVEIDRQIRAFNPAPGCFTLLRGETLKVWRAVLEPQASGRPGEVMRATGEGVHVACSEGALRLTELQRAGGKRLGAADFLRGCPLSAGDMLQ